ncbi:sarcosine oxidase subunit gamma [Phaeobacter sp.]|uniref:sarcosine oxidase subunit gamma n=1 Tax=Phaeobacter sp. TaxID=1902409 RepID=UPI0025FBD30E|nr:sarcosine oxidase subunit gamma [Phaeobacter sp.]
MVELREKSPCDGLLPLSIGALTVTELALGQVTSIAPYPGQLDQVRADMSETHGLRWPAANRSQSKQGVRLLWFGRDQALLIGQAADPKLAGHAALVDQSDGWACVALEGPGAEDVLARLCSIDLRPSVFKRGHSARCDLRHMMASVTRLGTQRFQIMVFRSMAQTLVHDLKTAMEAVAARG